MLLRGETFVFIEKNLSCFLQIFEKICRLKKKSFDMEIVHTIRGCPEKCTFFIVFQMSQIKRKMYGSCLKLLENPRILKW